MIRHAFGSGYHTTLVKLFGGHSSTMEASLQLNILEASVFIQQIISEWPASGGGQLHDPIQYQNEVSALFLVCPNSSPSLSGILFCLLQSTLSCSKIPRAFSSSLVMEIWTSSCPGIDGEVHPEECSLIKWYKALYFHMVGGSPETAMGHRGQWIGTFVLSQGLQGKCWLTEEPVQLSAWIEIVLVSLMKDTGFQPIKLISWSWYR